MASRLDERKGSNTSFSCLWQTRNETASFSNDLKRFALSRRSRSAQKSSWLIDQVSKTLMIRCTVRMTERRKKLSFFHWRRVLSLWLLYRFKFVLIVALIEIATLFRLAVRTEECENHDCVSKEKRKRRERERRGERDKESGSFWYGGKPDFQPENTTEEKTRRILLNRNKSRQSDGNPAFP